ncbi:hypothetical protein AB3M83_01770 [Microbacterium sp. 179-B 1A2 NHS]|uniref:hypothetical protein n=1 Tax=Microbacterium sp. 179-B 1A2 NHS TaxID=3142383 RepID=UPI0039A2FC83
MGIYFEPPDEEAVMTGADVHAVADDLNMAATLCDFLQQKTADHLLSLDRN